MENQHDMENFRNFSKTFQNKKNSSRIINIKNKEEGLCCYK